MLYQLSYMGLLFASPAPPRRAERQTGLLSARDSKVPKPRQICNLNDHGTASFQQKAPAN
ncbi:MAG: hypothetical protein DMF12_04965 [Verrucomicrobia bacterium]|nr:MAG: hypothetical protein DMF12_04965 [Verrucomicrobiota bacterium]